jgi:hypothetical protein
MTDLPIACTLTPDALWARQAGSLSDLRRRAEGRKDLPEATNVTTALIPPVANEFFGRRSFPK